MNQRLDLIDKVAVALHGNRRRRNPNHGAINVPHSPSSSIHVPDRYATAGECVTCREDATFVVDELGPIMQGAAS